MTLFRLFVSFLYTFFKNRFKGLPIYADSETVVERLKECNDCPYLNKGTCMACGCKVRIKAKFQDSECPQGEW